MGDVTSLTQPTEPVLRTKDRSVGAQAGPSPQVWGGIGAGLAFLVIVLLAYGLRVVPLGVQSLWYDEGFSVYLASQDLTSITTRTAADIHPPFYYYLLHFWLQLVGNSEFALRYLSLFWSVATVPLLWRLSADVYLWIGAKGKPQGIDRGATGLVAVPAALAACFAAISPAYVWYGQEGRMYGLLIFLCTVLVWLFLRTLRSGLPERRQKRFGRTLAFFAVGTLAAYTHFYALFALASLALLLSVWWLRHGRVRLAVALPLFVATGGVGLAYLPWLGFTLNRFSEDSSYYQGALDVTAALKQTLLLFAAGHTLDEATTFPMAIGFALLFFMSLIILSREKGGRFPGAALAVYLMVPVLMVCLVTYGRPKFHPRYLLLVSPVIWLALAQGLSILWGGGVRADLSPGPSPTRRGEKETEFPPTLSVLEKEQTVPPSHAGKGVRGLGRLEVSSPFRHALIGRTLAVLAGLFVVGVSFVSLGNLLVGERFLRDDWRSVAGYLEANAWPDDPVILISGHAFPVFTYYYHQDNWTPVPEGYTLSTQNTLNYNLANTLNRVVAGRSRLWVVRWQAEVVDPNDFLGALLSSKARRLTVGEIFSGLDLQLWEIPAGAQFVAEPRILEKVEVNYDHKIKILGFDADGVGSEAGALPTVDGTSGGLITLTIYWQALATLDRDYSLSLRLKDKAGRYWGRLDRRPTNYYYPTQRWKPGEIVFGRYELPVLAGTPPGEYLLEAEVYFGDAGKNTGLNVVGPGGVPQGISAPLAKLRLQRPETSAAVKAMQIRTPTAGRFGPLELLGYEAGPDQLVQGTSGSLTLFWQAVQRPEEDLKMVLEMVNGGMAYYRQRLDPVGEGYPTSRWQEGDRWRGQITFNVPGNAPFGESLLRVSIARGEEMLGDPITLQKLRIAERTRRTEVPANIQFPRRADLDGLVTFLGYDFAPVSAKPGEKVRLTLYWQAQRNIDRGFTVFTHLLDRADHIWGQRDGVPGGGMAPTTGWIGGEVVVDNYEIVIDKDAPPGPLQLEIGLYDSGSGERLKVDGNDDRVLLGQVQVLGK